MTEQLFQVDRQSGTKLRPSQVQALPKAVKRRYACHVARLCTRALYFELVTYPKPGLVSLVDTGSHTDMDARTFMRSIAALRHYFRDITLAGARQAPFSELKALGILAEQRMLTATGDVNTHRGAIFTLGLLAAASGWLYSERRAVTADALCALVRDRWGRDILAAARTAGNSHGEQMRQRFAAGGARALAASGFSILRETALPVLRSGLRTGRPVHQVAVQVFFSCMAELVDTNLLYRAGGSGLSHAQTAARRFLAAGGIAHPDWRRHAIAIHRQFVTRSLSPGGAADLLAATLLLHMLETPQDLRWD